jgi:hypothetical protein
LPREQIEGIAVRDGEKFTVLSTMRVQRKANEMRERNRCMEVQNSCRSYRHVHVCSRFLLMAVLARATAMHLRAACTNVQERRYGLYRLLRNYLRYPITFLREAPPAACLP